MGGKGGTDALTMKADLIVLRIAVAHDRSSIMSENNIGNAGKLRFKNSCLSLSCSTANAWTRRTCLPNVPDHSSTKRRSTWAMMSLPAETYACYMRA